VGSCYNSNELTSSIRLGLLLRSSETVGCSRTHVTCNIVNYRLHIVVQTLTNIIAK
jgi:hypothetical protein